MQCELWELLLVAFSCFYSKIESIRLVKADPVLLQRKWPSCLKSCSKGSQQNTNWDPNDDNDDNDDDDL